MWQDRGSNPRPPEHQSDGAWGPHGRLAITCTHVFMYVLNVCVVCMYVLYVWVWFILDLSIYFESSFNNVILCMVLRHTISIFSLQLNLLWIIIPKSVYFATFWIDSPSKHICIGSVFSRILRDPNSVRHVFCIIYAFCYIVTNI